MPSSKYLVEMTFTPFASLLAPTDVVAFTERFVLPTLTACQQLCDQGRIVAGGPTVAAAGFTFIAQADSPRELDQMVTALPLWARAQTRVVPLGEFGWRADAVKARLAEALSRTAPAAAAVSN